MRVCKRKERERKIRGSSD